MPSLQPYEGPKDDGCRVVGFVFEGNPLSVELSPMGEAVFDAGGVCAALGLAHVGSALRHLDEDEKGVRIKHTPGGVQKTAFVTEPGLYALISRSRRPEAKRFDRWVRHEVLPAIRKTGGYIAAAPSDTPEVIMAKALLVAQDTMQRQTAQLAQAEAEITTLTPRAVAFDQITRGNFLPSINKFCRTLEGVNLGAVNARLVELGYLYRDSALRDAYRVRRSHPKAAVFFREHISQREGWCNVTISLRPEGQLMISGLYTRGALPLTKAFCKSAG